MKTVTEGNIIIEVPDVAKPEEGEVFYNPHMDLARDISVCVYSQFDGTLCDALAASGARGLRLADKLNVTLNDANPNAVELMKRNAKLNGTNAEICCMKANSLLSERRFDMVDLDPFGSPVPFLDAASMSAVKMLGICATDTAPLAGVYPEVCKRRYMAAPLHNECFKEVAMRILCGYAIRNAAKYDIALRPVFVHTTRHYHRAYFSVSHGANKANRVLEEVQKWQEGGPMWLGRLWDEEIVKNAMKIAMTENLAKEKAVTKLLQTVKQENNMPPFFYDYHKICKELKVSPGKLDSLLERINGTRTHFSPTGIKTSLERDEVSEIILKTARTN